MHAVTLIDVLHAIGFTRALSFSTIILAFIHSTIQEHSLLVNI